MQKIVEKDRLCFEGVGIGPLSSTLSVVARDLERRDMWDVTAMQSIGRILSQNIKETLQPPDLVIKRIKKTAKRSMNCGKHLLAGALSAVVSKSVVAPIERVRMDIILNNTSYGPAGACAHILRTEGIRGFWRGNGLNIIRTAPFKAVNFFTFDLYSKLLIDFTGRHKSGDIERFVAGAMAGITALMICFPLDTIRTRLLSTKSSHRYKGVGDAFRRIARNEGFSALYRGCIPGIMSIAPGSAVFYGVYGTLKQSYINRQRIHSGTAFQKTSLMNATGEMYRRQGGLELPIGHSLLYGAIAGMCSEAIVYPLEVIRRQIQLQMTTNSARMVENTVVQNGIQKSFQSISLACSTIVQTQGLGGFYAGCLLNTVQVLPNAALSYFAYEAFKSLLSIDESSKTET